MTDPDTIEALRFELTAYERAIMNGLFIGTGTFYAAKHSFQIGHYTLCKQQLIWLHEEHIKALKELP